LATVVAPEDRKIPFRPRKNGGRIYTADGRKICAHCKEAKDTSEYSGGKAGLDSMGRKRLSTYCKPCDSKLASARNRKHPERSRLRGRESTARLRQEALDAYGRKCSCCGETAEQFLSIEHLNRDGRAHIKEVGWGFAIYRDLKKRGWPKDNYTLYCMNCNWGSRRTGICPHMMARLLEEVAA
jgi:hypothetical protein